MLPPPTKDLWGRPFEESVYQWLPSQFDISAEGRCTISSYINNLKRKDNPDLYINLQKLFEKFLPHFEAVCAYGRNIQFPESDLGPFHYFSLDKRFENTAVSLRSRSLQVITKIVDYELAPAASGGSKYEGVWHVEGMSHENIVATGLYILERGENIDGGYLLFKRAFLSQESTHMQHHLGQEADTQARAFVEGTGGGMFPLGSLRTPQGRMIVFPNSHVHKVSEMVNSAAASAGSSEKQVRRIIVFFLVNPEREIVSTKHAEVPQQETMSLDEALRHRLELMKERRLHKRDWNIRDVNLCEH
jgi:hypothetical protein